MAEPAAAALERLDLELALGPPRAVLAWLAVVDTPDANMAWELGMALARGLRVAPATEGKEPVDHWPRGTPLEGVLRVGHLGDHWEGLLDTRGWALVELPTRLAGVGRLAWVMSPLRGDEVRHGVANTIGALVAGYADALGVPVKVLHPEGAPEVLDAAERLERVTATEEAIRTALEAWSAEVDLPRDHALAAWRKKVVSHHGNPLAYVERMGLDGAELVPIDLDVEEAGGVDRIDRPGGRGTRSGRPRTLIDADRAAGRAPRWLVKAEPGAGKTTLLRQLAHDLAREGQTPLFVSLAEWEREGGDVLAAALRQMGDTETPPAEPGADLDRAWLFFDGFDEVRRHEDVRRRIVGLAAEARWARTPLVVTSRAGAGGEGVGPGVEGGDEPRLGAVEAVPRLREVGDVRAVAADHRPHGDAEPLGVADDQGRDGVGDPVPRLALEEGQHHHPQSTHPFEPVGEVGEGPPSAVEQLPVGQGHGEGVPPLLAAAGVRAEHRRPGAAPRARQGEPPRVLPEQPPRRPAAAHTPVAQRVGEGGVTQPGGVTLGLGGQRDRQPARQGKAQLPAHVGVGLVHHAQQPARAPDPGPQALAEEPRRDLPRRAEELHRHPRRRAPLDREEGLVDHLQLRVPRHEHPHRALRLLQEHVEAARGWTPGRGHPGGAPRGRVTPHPSPALRPRAERTSTYTGVTGGRARCGSRPRRRSWMRAEGGRQGRRSSAPTSETRTPSPSPSWL